VVFEVVSPDSGGRKRDEEIKRDEYVAVPTILRYVIVESTRRGFKAFWREPDEAGWREGGFDDHGPITVPEFGFDLLLDAVHATVALDQEG
jgi:Uma2 family endonuclease